MKINLDDVTLDLRIETSDINHSPQASGIARMKVRIRFLNVRITSMNDLLINDKYRWVR